MSIKTLENGRFLCQIDRARIPRKRKQFKTELEAEIYERQYLAKFEKQIDAPTDNRTLLELAETWYKYHGVNLSNGHKAWRRLELTALELGNPQANFLTPEQFVNYRHKKTVKGKTSQKTFNNIHAYLTAMYTKLFKLKVITYENPIKGVERIKIQERQLAYLSLEQIEKLFDSINISSVNPSTIFVTELCLRTGERWAEAEQLKLRQLHVGRITYSETKSKKVRTVPIDDFFYSELVNFAKGKGPNDRIFENCMGSFRNCADNTSIVFPQGQKTHILRHTFASHFVMNGGNVLTLSRILGHSDIKQPCDTCTYHPPRRSHKAQSTGIITIFLVESLKQC